MKSWLDTYITRLRKNPTSLKKGAEANELLLQY